MKLFYLLLGVVLFNSVGEPRPFFQLQHDALKEISNCMSKDDVNMGSLTTEIRYNLMEVAKLNGNIQRREDQEESYQKINQLFSELREYILKISSQTEGNNCSLWKLEHIISQTESDEEIQQFINPIVQVRFERQKIRNLNDYYRVDKDFYRKCSHLIFNITNRMKPLPNRG